MNIKQRLIYSYKAAWRASRSPQGLFVIILIVAILFFPNPPQQQKNPAATKTPVKDFQRTPTEAIAPPSDSEDSPQDQEYNFIILGNDYRSDNALRWESTQQSDVFVIVNVQLSGNTALVTLVSLARELYDEDRQLKIDQMYAAGGFELVESYISSLFNIEINGSVATNMDFFPDFVDDIGGIDLSLKYPIHDKCGSTPYDLDVEVMYHFDGKDTLCVTRMRMNSPRGYFDRQELHTMILVAIYQQFRGQLLQDPSLVGQLYNTYKDYIATNLDVIALAGVADDVMTSHLVFQRASMQPEVLELYPRPTNKHPYLYKMIVNPTEWWQEQTQ